MHDVTVQERFNDLVIATYGRGFWVLDDITPLQQLTTEAAAKAAHLFAPREAWRFRGAEPPYAPGYDPVTGENPKYGASINYWLKAKADSATITVTDASGTVVRTLSGPAEAGINRVMWELQGERSKEARVRVAPLDAPDRQVPVGGAPSPSIGQLSMLVPPGRYTVKLAAGGQEMTQALVVRKDPNTPGTEEDIRQQAAFWADVKGDLERTVAMINEIEVARYQLQSLKAVTTDTGVKTAVDAMDQKLVVVEGELTQLRITGRGQDLIRYPARLGEKLAYLANDVTSSDNAPTQSQRDVAAALRERLAASKAAFEKVMTQDVAAFNTMLRNKGIGGVSPP